MSPAFKVDEKEENCHSEQSEESLVLPLKCHRTKSTTRTTRAMGLEQRFILGFIEAVMLTNREDPRGPDSAKINGKSSVGKFVPFRFICWDDY
jgi:hypothetical protein